MRADWDEEYIEDAMGFVHDSLLQAELVEAADSISARLLELLGTFGDARVFQQAVAGHAEIRIDVIRQLAHRVERLEEILESYRDGRTPERAGFDALQRRLLDQGIEGEMGQDAEEE